MCLGYYKIIMREFLYERIIIDYVDIIDFMDIFIIDLNI